MQDETTDMTGRKARKNNKPSQNTPVLPPTRDGFVPQAELPLQDRVRLPLLVGISQFPGGLIANKRPW